MEAGSDHIPWNKDHRATIGGHMRMKSLTRAEFIARAVADRRKNKLRGQKEAYWVRSAHIDAERRKKR